MGGDCSRWYLCKKEKKEGGKETKNGECGVIFLLPTLMWRCSVHIGSKGARLSVRSKRHNRPNHTAWSPCVIIRAFQNDRPPPRPKSPTLRTRNSRKRNLCSGLQAYRAGIPGKLGEYRKAVEQADMSLFGQESKDRQKERGGVWDQGRNICLHFPLPFSLSFASWPGSAMERGGGDL